MTPAQLAWRAQHYVPWYERIGDAGMVGWATAAGYGIAALLCLGAGGRAAGRERALWLAAGLALLALGLNKQLDLQVALIEFWREVALAQGWYGARRMVQYAAFVLGALGAAALALGLLPVLRRQGRELRIAYAGLGLIGVYVALRAAKFQHVLWSAPGGPKGAGWLALLELGGLALVAVAALRKGQGLR